MFEDTFETMNTVAQIKVEGKGQNRACLKAKETILDFAERFNCFSPESEVTKLCENICAGKTYSISEDLYEILLTANQIKEETGGLFDVDFSNQDTQKDYHLEDGHSIIFDSVKTKLNLGAIAKGFAADKAMERIRQYDVDRAMISMGGHVTCFSNGACWRIGLQNPNKNYGELLGLLEIANGSLSTSAENYRGQHIKNPVKKTWKSSVGSVSVFGANGMLADAYSTALFLTDKTSRKNTANNNALDVIIVDGNIVYISENLSNKFSLACDEYKLKKY
jgi:thiamine biosynthesis lipoprotein